MFRKYSTIWKLFIGTYIQLIREKWTLISCIDLHLKINNILKYDFRLFNILLIEFSSIKNV